MNTLTRPSLTPVRRPAAMNLARQLKASQRQPVTPVLLTQTFDSAESALRIQENRGRVQRYWRETIVLSTSVISILCVFSTLLMA